MNEQWFVTKFPMGIDEGQVLWNLEYASEQQAQAMADSLNALGDGFEYEASDLPDIGTVYMNELSSVGLMMGPATIQ